jgi:hypothetical protein
VDEQRHLQTYNSSSTGCVYPLFSLNIYQSTGKAKKKDLPGVPTIWKTSRGKITKDGCNILAFLPF